MAETIASVKKAHEKQTERERKAHKDQVDALFAKAIEAARPENVGRLHVAFDEARGFVPDYVKGD